MASSNRKMSGGEKKRASPNHDEHLPIAEPDAVHEIGAPPVPHDVDPGGVAIDLSNSFLAEQITEGSVGVSMPLDSRDFERPGPKVSVVDRPAFDAAALPPLADGAAGSGSGSEQRRSTSDTDPPEARLGKVLAGRYRLERLIAKGGMGRVYLATQLPLERQVAVKILVNQRYDEEFRQRFFLEASTCARLVHRHIVTIHDYGEAENGELFMSMEFLDGIPLSKLIQKLVRLPSDRACKIALQVCRALRAAHKTGIVHRDLKPGNVIVLTDEDQDENDFIKVLDFGLVKAFQDRAKPSGIDDLTKSGTWLGSPRYMAPEQIRCQPVDPRADIYSLGIILFHMLAGRPPFVGSNSMEVLEQHLRDDPPSIAEVLGRSDYAPELEVIVGRCLKKDPAQRYQSMDELIGDLKAAFRLITGVSIHTESTLPTFSQISDPSLSFVPLPNSPPVPDPSVSGMATRDSTSGSGRGAPVAPGVVVTSTGWRPDASAQGRMTGTVRTPLEVLESSRPGVQRPPERLVGIPDSTPGHTTGRGRLSGSPSTHGRRHDPSTQGLRQDPSMRGAGAHPSVHGRVDDASARGRFEDPSIRGRFDDLSTRGASPNRERVGAGWLWPVGILVALLLVTPAAFFAVRFFAPGTADTVTVRVDSKPVGAEVYLDGQLLGRTPLNHALRGVAPGTMRTFIVRKDGHEDLALAARLEGERVALHAALVPMPPEPPPLEVRRERSVRPVAPARPRPVTRRRSAESSTDGRQPSRGAVDAEPRRRRTSRRSAEGHGRRVAPRSSSESTSASRVIRAPARPGSGRAQARPDSSRDGARRDSSRAARPDSLQDGARRDSSRAARPDSSRDGVRRDSPRAARPDSSRDGARRGSSRAPDGLESERRRSASDRVVRETEVPVVE